MSNFNGTARSNYFMVKDPEAFKEWVMSCPNLGFWEKGGGTTYAVYSDDPDTGCWTMEVEAEKSADGEEVSAYFNLIDGLIPHLQDGQVCVLMEAGAEKMRYISGWAQAFDNTGKTVLVSLGDIYTKAKEAFGVGPNEAEY